MVMHLQGIFEHVVELTEGGLVPTAVAVVWSTEDCYDVLVMAPVESLHKTATLLTHSMHAAQPCASNELPFSLHDTALSLPVFNAHLKTFIFPSRVRPRCICDINDFFAPHINVLTYLLTYLYMCKHSTQRRSCANLIAAALGYGTHC